VKRISERLTYANVMATIAVFLVLGGATAYAALGRNSVGSKQLKKNAVTAAKIKKNAITTAKIRNRAVTAAKLDLSALPTVPSATTATNALTVNGQSQTKVFKSLSAGQTGAEVATIAGFTLRATCATEDIDVSFSGPASGGSVVMSATNGRTEGPDFRYGTAAPGDPPPEVPVDGPSPADNIYGVSVISGATPGGTVISGEISYDYNSFGESQPGLCIVFGEITSG
jgi:hypothetical protein